MCLDTLVEVRNNHRFELLPSTLSWEQSFCCSLLCTRLADPRASRNLRTQFHLPFLQTNTRAMSTQAAFCKFYEFELGPSELLATSLDSVYLLTLSPQINDQVGFKSAMTPCPGILNLVRIKFTASISFYIFCCPLCCTHKSLYNTLNSCSKTEKYKSIENRAKFKFLQK